LRKITRTTGFIAGGKTHLLTVPLLTAPAQPVGINDASPGSAATFVLIHRLVSYR
jgi:hypothetical protein